MPNPHNDLVQSALVSVAALGVLFDTIRSGDGPIWKAYATIIRAGLSEDSQQTLMDAVAGASRRHLSEALALGMDHAQRDAEVYGQPVSFDGPRPGRAVDLVGAQVALQLGRAELVEELGAGEDELSGGESRAGILDPIPVIGAVTFFATRLATAAYGSSMAATLGTRDFVRQAVAVLDQNTTETCINVHGQIVEENEDFHLTGVPRDADDMHDPPFHKGCRTSVALIDKRYVDPAVTADMREEANEVPERVSTRAGMAKYHVYGNKVREFREGRWHALKQLRSNFEARQLAASLNNAIRS